MRIDLRYLIIGVIVLLLAAAAVYPTPKLLVKCDHVTKGTPCEQIKVAK